MAKRITMVKTAACPDHVLEAGKTYNVHDTVAANYLNDPGDGSGPAAVLADPQETKVHRITQPDPQDENKGKPAPKHNPALTETDDDDDSDIDEDKVEATAKNIKTAAKKK